MKIARFIVLFGIPMLLGTAGFMAAGEGLLQAMFMTVQLFLIENGDLPPNLAIEIARWTAPLATAGGVFLAVEQLRTWVYRAWVSRKSESTAVYGPEADKRKVLKQLGNHGIDGGESFVRAHRYVLLGEESANLQFYQMHRDALEDATVYLKCNSIPAQSIAGANIRLYCPEEIAVRLYRKNNCLYEASREAGHRIDVVFVGFGKLGEELLISSLQTNIFSPDQMITYHIFGEDNGFLATHPGLQYLEDQVRFYDEPWYAYPVLLDGAARVIVLEQNEQLSLVRKLLLLLKRDKIDIFTAEPLAMNLLAEQKRLCVFDWKSEAGKLENILGETLYDRAKRINMRYVLGFGGGEAVQDDEAARQKEWEKLTPFHRYSNIRAADYHEVQEQILEAEGIELDFDKIPDVWKERLSVLEHISWCSYYYLNNWECGDVKSEKLRTHPDLIQFRALNEEEKRKDWSNIEGLFRMK